MKLIGWDTGTDHSKTLVLLGYVSKGGKITVKKELFGEEAERYLHEHQRQVNAVLSRERSYPV